MAKKLLAAVFGLVLAPAFIAAEYTAGNSLVGTVCLVRVYNTNFAFPPQGGRIVQIGNETFFWRTYLPECANVLPANQPVVVTSTTGANSVNNTLNGSLPPQFVGEPCAVRVYHTDFRFPEGGGKIIQLGNELFFIRTYKPGCENAGSGGIVLASSPNSYNPLDTNSQPQQAYVNPMFSSVRQNPSVTTTHQQPYVAPPTGTSNCY
ncbi:MAG: hypothetical protein KW793_02680 [Candidatus Doudnabacteria bacterium]|nr:hypothetical protein [Candidatus Doudnabacteria bacterium]